MNSVNYSCYYGLLQEEFKRANEYCQEEVPVEAVSSHVLGLLCLKKKRVI